MSVKQFEDARWRLGPQKLEFRHRAALELVPAGSVLDVGCGDGLLLGRLKEAGHRVAGVDLSAEAVARCSAAGIEATEHSLDEPLPFQNGAFETVIALDVLEHVYDPDTVLSEACRVAAKNVVIGVPNFSSLPARLQVLTGRVPENNHPGKGHVYWFNWQVLTSLLARHHLVVSDIRVNAPWERLPIAGVITRALARAWPNLFALSFVVRATKRS